MWEKIKSITEWVFALLFTLLTEIMNSIQLETLQKIFYFLSIILLLIAMVKLLKGKKMGVERVVQAPSVVNNATNIEEKASFIYKILKKIKKGVVNMFERIKAFGVTKAVTIVLNFILIGLAFLSAFVPELNWIQENILWVFGAVGLTGAVGAWSKGAILGERAKVRMEKRQRLAEIKSDNKKLNVELKQLDVDYEYLNPFIDRVFRYGGELSPEDAAAKNTYDMQRSAILEKLTKNRAETKEINEFLIKDKEENVDEEE